MNRTRHTLTFSIVLLAGTLSVACALAWQAHEAAQSHRHAAERVLQDYVRFAGWEFARAARRELDSVFDRWPQVVRRDIACDVPSGDPWASSLRARGGDFRLQHVACGT